MNTGNTLSQNPAASGQQLGTVNPVPHDRWARVRSLRLICQIGLLALSTVFLLVGCHPEKKSGTSARPAIKIEGPKATTETRPPTGAAPAEVPATNAPIDRSTAPRKGGPTAVCQSALEAPARIESGVRLMVDLENLGPMSGFELRFDQPVIAQDRVGTVAESSPLAFEPRVSGTWTWLSRRSGLFAPDEPLRMATRYRLTLRQLAGPDDKPIDARLQYEFHTPGFAVLDPPGKPDANASAECPFQLHFTADVDPAAASLFIGFENASGQRAGVVVETDKSWSSEARYFAGQPKLAPWRLRRIASAGDRGSNDSGDARLPSVLAIKPAGPLPPGPGWRLVLRKGLPSADCEFQLDKTVEFPIGDVLELKITNASAHSILNRGRFIVLDVNKYIRDRDFDIRPLIRVSPAPDKLVIRQRFDDILIDGGFGLGTNYTVEVSPGLLAHDGTQGTEKFVATLLFEPLAPRLYFPEEVSHQQAHGGREFGFASVNVPGARVRAYRVAPSSAAAVLDHFESQYPQPAPTEDQRDDCERYRRVDFAPTPLAPALTQVWERVFDTAAASDDARVTRFSWDEVLGAGKSGMVLLEIESTGTTPRIGAQTLVQVTDLGAVCTRDGGEWRAWVFSHQTGEPLAGVTVGSGDRRATTGADGIARLPGQPQLIEMGRGEDVHLTRLDRDARELETWGFDIPRGYGEPEKGGPPLRILAFTERPVYRPGETVHLKVIARALDGKGLSLPEARAASIRFADNHDRDFYNEAVGLGVSGTLSVSVALPDDVLGQCTAHIELGGQTAEHTFQVADYQPDAFEVNIGGARDYAPGQMIDLSVACRYYFGKALSGAGGKWSLSGSAAPFAPTGFDDFLFLSGDCDHRLREADSHFNEEGDIALDADGACRLSPKAAQAFAGPAPQWFRLLAEVTDVNQQTVSQSASFTRHASDFYLGLRRPDGPIRAGEPIPVEIVAVDPDGQPHRGAVGARARLYYVEWLTQDIGGASHSRFYRAEPRLHLLAEAGVTTGRVAREGTRWRYLKGSGPRVAFTAEKTGKHLVEIEARDAAGRRTVTRHDFTVFGPGVATWDFRDAARIEVETDKAEYRAGETATLLIKSPIAGTALVSVERETVLRSFVARIEKGRASVQVPLLACDAPNVFASVVVVRGSDACPHQHPAPEYRFGYCQLKVADPATRLGVEVQPGSGTYRPGSEVAIQAVVRDDKGRPVPDAEVTLYAVDEGVLALMGYETPEPHRFFFTTRPLRVDTCLTLARLMPEDPNDRRYTNKGFLVGGGGDSAESLRRNMLACAYWNASLKTDKGGRVAVTFRAPDSLTRYRVIAVALSGASRFGNAQSSFEIRKPVMIQPSHPMFARLGDRLSVRAVAHNQTEGPGTLRVSLALDGRARSTEASPSQSIKIAAGGTAVIDFPVEFVAAGPSRWTWRARLTPDAAARRTGPPTTAYGDKAPKARPPAAAPEEFADAVETQITVEERVPLLRRIYSTRVTPDQGDLLRGVDPAALEARGQLTITVANSPLAQLAGAADSLIHYPYGCVEQTSSSLLPLLVLGDSAGAIPGFASRARQIAPMVRKGITRLLDMQTPSGGLAYWPGDTEPDPWGSAWGCAALAIARSLGHQVPPQAMDPLCEYLRAQMANAALASGDAQLGPRCLAAWALALARSPDPSYHEILFSKRGGLSPENRALLALAILESAGPRAMAEELAADLPDADHVISPWFYDAARDIALRLMVSARLGHIDEAGRLADRLLAHCQGGDWHTTQGNAWAVLALSDFVRKGRADAGPAQGTILYGGARLADFSLDPSGGFAETRIDLPAKEAGARLQVQGATAGPLFARLVFESRPDAATRMPQERGFAIGRAYHKILDDGSLARADDLRLGDRVMVTLSIQSQSHASYVAIEDPLPSVFEAINPEFRSREAAGSSSTRTTLWSSHREMRADRLIWFVNHMPAGQYQIQYLARVRAAGEAEAPAAQIGEMYRPDRLGTTAPDHLGAGSPR
ncbi:MAG TPA: alpha-2-macroglobulin family protein [Verrucomicrobiae bacterium]|nr:alpha-2-macroglobulin family protein [Verrucomicrobiae bacterium]